MGIYREQVLTNPAITRTHILRSPVRLCHFGLRGFSYCQWRKKQAHAQARLLNHPAGREPALNRAAGTATTPNVDLWIIITPNGRELEAAVNSLELHRTTLPTNCLNSHSQLSNISIRTRIFDDETFSAICGGINLSIAYSFVGADEERLKVVFMFSSSRDD